MYGHVDGCNGYFCLRGFYNKYCVDNNVSSINHFEDVKSKNKELKNKKRFVVETKGEIFAGNCCRTLGNFRKIYFFLFTN